MKGELIPQLLVQQYNQPVPRYTSYPTVPYWNETIDGKVWEQHVVRRFEEENATNGIALYIHLPFCESLCTYCGCNKKITTNHSVEEEYLSALKKEWLRYRQLMKQTPVIREIHLGGGTPTFFSPANLKKLMQLLLKSAIIHPRYEFSVEGHPSNTSSEHLKVLFEAGFRRISFGVQDLDERVQQVINRIQPFSVLQEVTENARKAGFTSVNFDLIYGLPLQTGDSISSTIEQVLTLQPDRIAFYSYAHVPWTSRSQRLFNESHLPSATEKIKLYLLGKEMLLQAGYQDIGMDHFALPNDTLSRARVQGRLHRNFMGYTSSTSKLLLGLGVSAISDTGTAYAQNEKSLHDYYLGLEEERLPLKKGYFLNDEDRQFKQYILEIACKGNTRFRNEDLPLLQAYVFPVLQQLQADGLIEWNLHSLHLTPLGHYFIRNVCAAFDLCMHRGRSAHAGFSKAI